MVGSHGLGGLVLLLLLLLLQVLPSLLLQLLGLPGLLLLGLACLLLQSLLHLQLETDSPPLDLLGWGLVLFLLRGWGGLLGVLASLLASQGFLGPVFLLLPGVILLLLFLLLGSVLCSYLVFEI